MAKKPAYSIAELRSAAAQARSMPELLSLLGLKNSGGRRAAVQRDLDAHGIGTSHFRRPRWQKYPPELLAAAVAESTSINQVLDFLGIPRSGGAHTHISRRIKAAGISTTHFSHNRDLRTGACEQFDPDTLAAAADNAKSMRQVLRRLGVSEYGRVRDDVRRQLRAHGIDEPLLFRRLELDEPTVRRVAASSRSVAEMLRALDLPVGETNRRRILRYLGRYGIDTSHFRRGLTSTFIQRPGPDPRAILVERPPGSNRVPGARLRKALILTGRAPRCACCGVGESWQGKPLNLEVDHINGDPLDNRQENLRLLCPNCHSQTETFAGRNRRSGQRHNA